MPMTLANISAHKRGPAGYVVGPGSLFRPLLGGADRRCKIAPRQSRHAHGWITAGQTKSRGARQWIGYDRGITGGENLMHVKGTNRRAFIAALGSAAAWPLLARAQAQRPIPVVGYLSGNSSSTVPLLSFFREG